MMNWTQYGIGKYIILENEDVIFIAMKIGQ